MIDFLVELDTKLLLFLNGIHSPFWDNIMFFFSKPKTWVPLYLFLIGWIIYKFRWKSIPIILGLAILITLSDQISVHCFKHVFQRFRPSRNPFLKCLVHIVNGYRGGRFGFVSSHAANTFAAATFISFTFKKRPLTIFIFAWAAIVSYTRIYLGVHFPADIVGGALLGMVLGYLVYLGVEKVKGIRLKEQGKK